MLGQLDVVKATIAASPGIHRIPGPHSISLLTHAKAGGAQAEAVKKYLESLGDADGQASPAQSADELAALAGVYKFGADGEIEIAVMKNGRLQFGRKGTTHRFFLIPAGAGVFHPVGAKAVRIQFAGDVGEMVMTIHDPGLVLTARRGAAAR